MGKSMYELRDMLCDELDKVAEQGELTAGSLELVDKLTHSIKSIDTILAMEEAYGDDYSRDDGRMYDDGHSYNRGRGGYNRGNSYARGRRGNVRRDSMGRYSRDGGYSYVDAKQDMIAELKELAAKAPDDKTKQEIEHFANEMESK